jgi:hypothetical protein
MTFLVNAQSNWSRDGLCTACTNVQVSPEAHVRGMIWGQMNLENVSKASKPPIKQSPNSVLTSEMYVCNVLASHDNAHGHFWAVLGSCERACRTDSARCRTTLSGKLTDVLPTR